MDTTNGRPADDDDDRPELRPNAIRDKIAKHLLHSGPAPARTVFESVGCSAPTFYAHIKHPWFTEAGPGRYQLSDLGRE
ncbi:hypothetical protein ABTM13_19810, partial [Acinetobacter baumannii]